MPLRPRQKVRVELEPEARNFRLVKHTESGKGPSRKTLRIEAESDGVSVEIILPDPQELSRDLADDALPWLRADEEFSADA